MMSAISTAGAVTGGIVAGMAAWTLGEYVIHRFLMHEFRGRGLPSREHLLHHADPEENPGRPLLSWIGIVVVGASLFLVPGLLVLGVAVGWAPYVGWLVGYGVYERIHNRAHTHGPRGAYGRWVRRHHFFHHHGHPMRNHGVTSPIWDRVFGTYETPTRIVIPRRHAMPWLVDAAGSVRAPFRSLYVLAGPADRNERSAALDRARAFANLTLQA
jgi:sterol desaturase/sphingolipid hydroxylase (fatty acid hydroxylase superfamily)